MALSLFWSSIGMAFVSSRLVSRSLSRQSLSFIFAEAFFSTTSTRTNVYHERVRFVRRVVSRSFSVAAEGVYTSRLVLQPSYRFSQEDCLSFARRQPRRRRFERKSCGSATRFCLVDWQRCTQIVIRVYERKAERKRKKE